MKSEHETTMLQAFLIRLDIADALAEKTRFEELQKRMTVKEEPKIAPAPAQIIEAEELKDIKVIFYATTASFRQEMKLLTEKHNVKYGGIKDGE
jgi:hypothetical protein